MKRLILILLLFTAAGAKAQEASTLKDYQTHGDKDMLYVIDGKKMHLPELMQLPDAEIGELLIFRDAEGARKMYGAEADHGVITLYTRGYMIKTYQETFSGLSDDYESYLTSHGTDDKGFIYVVDGKPLQKGREEIQTLFQLNKDRVDSLVFTQNEPEGSKVLARVIITTKK